MLDENNTETPQVVNEEQPTTPPGNATEQPMGPPATPVSPPVLSVAEPTLPSNTDGKPKKSLIKKLAKITGVLLLLAGIVVAVIMLLPNTDKVIKEEIEIGDTTITQDDIGDYVASLENLYASNPGLKSDKDVRAEAEDDLILNAAFKMYAKQCGVTIQNSQIAEMFGEQNSSEKDATRFIEEKRANDRYAVMRTENEVYKKVLQSCIVAEKEVFAVFVNYDSPYFNNLNAERAAQEYEKAKEFLRKDFLPLFEQGMSTEDIAKRADFNQTATDFVWTKEMMNKYHTQITTMASINRAVGSDYYNDIDVKYPASPGDIISMNEAVAKLNKVGEHTDVLVAKTGWFVIARLETKKGGEFGSYDEFLKHIKNKYVYTPTQKTILAAKHNIENIANWLSQRIFTNVYAASDRADCGTPSHDAGVTVRAWDTVNSKGIPGMQFSVSQSAKGCYATGTTNSSGYVYATHDCNYESAYYSFNTATPSNYTYQSHSISPSYRWYSGPWTGTSSPVSQLPAYFILFSGDNGAGPNLGDVLVYYKPSIDWHVNVKTTIPTYSAADLAPGKNVVWTHQAQQVGPTATNAAVNFTLDHTGTTGNAWTGTITNSTDFANGRAVDSNYTTVRTETGPAITQDDVGKKFCSKVTATPGGGGSYSTAARSSTSQCVEVPYNWYISLETTYSYTCDTVASNGNCLKPGDTLTFTHKARQMGPTKTNAVVDFSLSHTNSTDVSWVPTSTTNPIENFASGRLPDTAMQIIRTEARTITQDDVGKYLCSQITATPGGGQSGVQPTDSRSSTVSCVYIPYDYELTPTTDTNSGGAHGGTSGTISYDDPIIFTGHVTNMNGNVNGPTKSRSTDWQAFIFVIPNTVSKIPEGISRSSLIGTLSNSYVGTIYGLSSVSNYESIGTRDNPNNCAGSDTRTIFTPGASVDVCKTIDLANKLNEFRLNLGDRICFAVWTSMSWAEPANTHTDAKQTSTNRSYSAPSCLTVSKSPQIQLKGANSKSGAKRFGQTELTGSQYGGGFEGRFSSNPDRGSWSQHGLLSSGNITNFGSTGYTLDSNRDKACKLLFANVPEGGNGGSNCNGNDSEKYGKLGIDDRIITIPKMAERNKTELNNLESKGDVKKLTNTTFSLTTLASGTYYSTSDLTITASTLAKKKFITIVAVSPNTSTKSTITIAGNIETNPADTYTKMEEVPNLTIIADNINVQSVSTTTPGQTITKLFGTYIAKERFSTCTYQYNSTSFAGNSGGTSIALAGLELHYTPTTNGSGLCQNQLTVQGAVITKNRPELRRVFGAGRDDQAIPSEVFNYTPNLYLTPYTLGQTGNANNWQMTDLRQLPSRL